MSYVILLVKVGLLIILPAYFTFLVILPGNSDHHEAPLKTSECISVHASTGRFISDDCEAYLRSEGALRR